MSSTRMPTLALERFTLDGSPECSGVHPDEQTQGVVVMPDEAILPPQEVRHTAGRVCVCV